MASVTPDSVRECINVSVAQAPYDAVNRFITGATATIKTETGLTNDPSNCTEEQEVAIGNLAAIYCTCRITGGFAS